MTPKEALDIITTLNESVDMNDYMQAVDVLKDTLTERDIYYQALCDIESGKDVRMILERVLT